jgi:hypothetical protein
MSSSQSALFWRGYINQITYGTDLRARVDGSLVVRLADELIRQRYFSDPVEDYYQAAIDGLRSGESLRFDDDQDEGAVRDLLTRLLRTLDERRRWPEPPFRSIPVDEWLALQDAPVIGRIRKYPMHVEEVLSRIFSERGPEGPIMVLRMRTGQQIGLRATSWGERNVELSSKADPEATREAFCDLTGLDVQPA